ncbi:MAG TPA: hypothetical protein VGM05_05790 [Planctomycetaceae bacterium]|jgi:hypothetical protein
MKRWFAALSAALLCLGVSLSAGWLWQTMADAKCEACARLLQGEDDTADDADGETQPRDDEARVLSPAVLSAAAALLQDRGVPLPLPSPFDPVGDYLLEHTRVCRPEHAQPGEICIRCEAVESEEALQILNAIVDAYLAVGASEPVGDAELADDAAQVELTVEREQLTQAIERQQQSIAEMTRRLEAAKIETNGPEADDPAPLETELARVRQAHREAATRLAQARREFDNKVAPESIASRITEAAARTRVLERLNLSKVRDELERQEGLQQKWSAVYGKNHPRMVEIREKIEVLEEQLAASPFVEQAGRSTDSQPATIVLAAFESESTSLEEAEQKLMTHLGGVQERFHGQQQLELQLGEARQELAFLHGEYDRTQKQIVTARRDHADPQPSLISPPALVREPIGPRAGLPMAVSCVTGMALYLLLLWQIRGKWLTAERVDLARSRSPAAPARRERFRSQEEEQLMRLKLASRG